MRFIFKSMNMRRPHRREEDDLAHIWGFVVVTHGTDLSRGRWIHPVLIKLYLNESP